MKIGTIVDGRALNEHMLSRAVVVVALMIVPWAAVAVAHNPRGQTVTGTYQSNWDEVKLEQRGKRIWGSYVCCGGGVIEGRIDGNTIKYSWSQGEGVEGRGVWTVVAPGKLDGTWGWNDDDKDGGDWNLERVTTD